MPWRLRRNGTILGIDATGSITQTLADGASSELGSGGVPTKIVRGGGTVECLADGSIVATPAAGKDIDLGGSFPRCAERTFTETAGAGQYNASVAIPAGGRLVDIQITATAEWTATTSATGIVGDTGDDDGFWTGLDLKTGGNLALGRVLSLDVPGSQNGPYNDPVEIGGWKSYYPSGGTITAKITTVGAAGSAGRTRLLVLYAVPTPVAAVKS